MKNKLTDLNDILFSQLERLTDEVLSPDQLEGEIRRASAIVQVADKIVDNAKLQLDAVKFAADRSGVPKNVANMIALPAEAKQS